MFTGITYRRPFADAVVSGKLPIAGQVVKKDDGTALVKLDNGFKQPLPAFLTGSRDCHQGSR